jgi:hypothetical protein
MFIDFFFMTTLTPGIPVRFLYNNKWTTFDMIKYVTRQTRVLTHKLGNGSPDLFLVKEATIILY